MKLLLTINLDGKVMGIFLPKIVCEIYSEMKTTTTNAYHFHCSFHAVYFPLCAFNYNENVYKCIDFLNANYVPGDMNNSKSLH